MFNSKFYNSVARGDISMSFKQYEEQAKHIQVEPNRKKNLFSYKISEMKFDDLVDRFLLKDSESNIQMMTSMTGLEISGFTHSMINEQSLNPAGMKISMLPAKAAAPPQRNQQTKATFLTKKADPIRSSIGFRK